MLKLLFMGIMIFPFLLFSKDSFALPQESSYFISTLNQDLLTAKKEVLISSSIINEYSLIKTLKRLSKKGIRVSLVTQVQTSENKALSLGLLKGISVYTTKGPKTLLGAFICIDGNVFYLGAVSLDYKLLRRDYSFVVKQNRQCKELFTKLLNKSTKIK